MDYDSSSLNATDSAATAAGAAFLGVYVIFALVLTVVGLVAMWKIFTKAGKPGWAALVPVYNLIVLLEIVGRPKVWAWSLLLLLIPVVNSIYGIVLGLVLALDLAKVFGKSQVFGVVALWLFSIVGFLILGFGKDKYLGPIAGKPAAPATAPPAAPAA